MTLIFGPEAPSKVRNFLGGVARRLLRRWRCGGLRLMRLLLATTSWPEQESDGGWNRERFI